MVLRPRFWWPKGDVMGVSNSGFTMVSNDIYLVTAKLGASAYRVYDWLHRKSIGFHKTDVACALRTISKNTNLCVNTVRDAIRELELAGLIVSFKTVRKTTQFQLLGLVATDNRGFQFTEEFLSKFGVKARKKAVSETDTADRPVCIKNRHSAVSETDTYKERKINSLNKAENYFQTGGSVRVADSLIESIRRHGVYNFAGAIASTGLEEGVARKILKEFGGWGQLCNTNPKMIPDARSRLRNIAASVLCG